VLDDVCPAFLEFSAGLYQIRRDKLVKLRRTDKHAIIRAVITTEDKTIRARAHDVVTIDHALVHILPGFLVHAIGIHEKRKTEFLRLTKRNHESRVVVSHDHELIARDVTDLLHHVLYALPAIGIGVGLGRLMLFQITVHENDRMVEFPCHINIELCVVFHDVSIGHICGIRLKGCAKEGAALKVALGFVKHEFKCGNVIGLLTGQRGDYAFFVGHRSCHGESPSVRNRWRRSKRRRGNHPRLISQVCQAQIPNMQQGPLGRQ